MTRNDFFKQKLKLNVEYENSPEDCEVESLSWFFDFEFERVYLVLFMLNSINIKEKTNNTPNSLTRHGLKPLMLGV